MTQKKSNTHDAKRRLPQFFRFLIPLIEVLKEMGGNAKSSDVISEIIVRKKPRGAYRASKYLVQIYEDRAFLAKTGYLGFSPKRDMEAYNKGPDPKDPRKRFAGNTQPKQRVEGVLVWRGLLPQ